MTTAELAHKAGGLLEETPLSQRDDDAIRLMLYHVLYRLGDDGHAADQARLLCRLLDGA